MRSSIRTFSPSSCVLSIRWSSLVRLSAIDDSRRDNYEILHVCALGSKRNHICILSGRVRLCDCNPSTCSCFPITNKTLVGNDCNNLNGKAWLTLRIHRNIETYLYFWCFLLHLFFRLLILHLWVSHLNWLSLDDWLLWLFRFFLGLDFWLFRDLLLRLDSFCNFFYQFFDWWLSFYFLLLSSWLLFEAFRTEEVRVLGAVECFAVATELLLYVVIVLGFHFVRRWLSLVWRCDLCSWLWTE